MPIISVDTKKKELIGNFKNAGQTWRQTAVAVNDHDFEQDALGKAVPYGIYDLKHNRGYVYVGQSADTPQFAVDNIVRWWVDEGQFLYPGANKLLILADAGGSNGCRPRLWKLQLQQQLANRLGLEVTVCHYPTGTSKWNPIEHRLFSLISINWAGKPLRTFEFMLACIRGAKTATGLQVKAYSDRGCVRERHSACQDCAGYPMHRDARYLSTMELHHQATVVRHMMLSMCGVIFLQALNTASSST